MSQEEATLCGGRYRLLGVLGAGGMAKVHRAYDRRLDVYRAIKILSPELYAHPTIRRRFLSEARTMARLAHPNLVMAHDVGVDGDQVVIVMELVDGGSLWDFIKRNGPLSPLVALEVLRGVLPALQFAHDRGVIHRDLKPGNVLMTKEGDYKLADFGIARVAETDALETRTGTMMGTPAYMAPEQRAGSKEIDGRADLYSLGATLFSLLTLETPTDLHAPEAQEDQLSAVPAQMRHIIERAVRYRPTDRYATASEMLDEVNAIHAALKRARDAETGPIAMAPLTPGGSGRPRDGHRHTIVPGPESLGESLRGGHSEVVERTTGAPRMVGPGSPDAPGGVVVAGLFDLEEPPPPAPPPPGQLTASAGSRTPPPPPSYHRERIVRMPRLPDEEDSAGDAPSSPTLDRGHDPEATPSTPTTTSSSTRERFQEAAGRLAATPPAHAASLPPRTPAPGDRPATAPTTAPALSKAVIAAIVLGCLGLAVAAAVLLSGDGARDATQPDDDEQAAQVVTPEKPAAPATLPAVTGPAGRLVVDGRPGATVLLDGKPVGQTPVDGPVSLGRHAVRLQVADGRKVEIVLTVTESEPSVFCWDFEGRTRCDADIEPAAP